MSAVELRLGDRRVLVDLDGDVARIDGRTFTITTVGSGLYRVTDDARHWVVAVAGPPDNRWLSVDGHVAVLEADPASLPARRRERSPSDDLASPMPATVLRVLVQAGDKVSRGDSLVLLEAMKMELPIRAPRDGVVRAVHCKPGELVQPAVNLLDLE